jgi:RNA:NAD 2'-phosphotransferase (TPT1/KptA family)
MIDRNYFRVFKMSCQAAKHADVGSAKQLKIQERVSKRLSYVLRYGAIKEGLRVYDGGYVKLNDLVGLPSFKNDDKLVVAELQSSTSWRNLKRFEIKCDPSGSFVRATYGRKFERSKFHPDCKVPRLLELTLDYVADNVASYDFDNFPDQYLIR